MLISAFLFSWHHPFTWVSRLIRFNRIIILWYNNKCCMLHIWIFLGGIFSRFQLFLLNVGGVYTPSNSHDHSYYGTLNRTSNRIGARSIVRSSGLSRDPIVLFLHSRFHCTTVAYRCKLYRKVQCVYIAHRSLRSCKSRTNTFFICNYFGNNVRFISFFFGRTNILSLLLVYQLWNGVKTILPKLYTGTVHPSSRQTCHLS